MNSKIITPPELQRSKEEQMTEQLTTLCVTGNKFHNFRVFDRSEQVDTEKRELVTTFRFYCVHCLNVLATDVHMPISPEMFAQMAARIQQQQQQK